MPTADFSKWERATLEAFARQAADENRELREDLKAAMAAWRQAVTSPLRPEGQQEQRQGQ